MVAPPLVWTIAHVLSADMAVQRDVVACVVANGEQICLVQRSHRVSSDQGLWHCVTGYVEQGVTPSVAALNELSEELGLQPQRIDRLRRGTVLRYQEGDVSWVVHTFLAETRQRRFELNWENDAYVWSTGEIAPDDRVPWLVDVCRNFGYLRPSERGRPRRKVHV